jgi:hypothetical protein
MVKRLLTEVIKAGGTLVPEQTYRDRLAICHRCNKAGTVTVLGMQFDGCTECGCPFATKLRAGFHPLDGGKVKCPEGKW